MSGTLVEDLSRVKEIVQKIADSATQHGWDGVNNSKLLEVFIDTELSAREDMGAELACLQGRERTVSEHAEIITSDLRARLTASEAECARLKVENTELRSSLTIQDESIEASQSERARLREYATHRKNCKAVWSYQRPKKDNGEYHPVLPCDCGLAALLAPAPASVDPQSRSALDPARMEANARAVAAMPDYIKGSPVNRREVAQAAQQGRES